jgi:hypothetical protein
MVLGAALTITRDLPSLYARVKPALSLSIHRGTVNPLAIVWTLSPDFIFLQIGTLLAFTTLQVAFVHIKQPYRGKSAQKSRIRKIVEAKLERFREGLLWIWSSWLIAYLWLAICWKLKGGWYEIPDPLIWAFADLVALCNGCACFYCFLILDQSRSFPKTRRRSAKLSRRFGHAAVWGLAAATISFAARASSIGALRTLSVVPIAFYNGFIMMSLFSRFEKPKMKHPSLLPWLICLYTLLHQVNMNFVGPAMNPLPRAILLLSELILEAPLFVVLTYQMADGTMLKYAGPPQRA